MQIKEDAFEIFALNIGWLFDSNYLNRQKKVEKRVVSHYVESLKNKERMVDQNKNILL